MDHPRVPSTEQTSSVTRLNCNPSFSLTANCFVSELTNVFHKSQWAFFSLCTPISKNTGPVSSRKSDRKIVSGDNLGPAADVDAGKNVASAIRKVSNTRLRGAPAESWRASTRGRRPLRPGAHCPGTGRKPTNQAFTTERRSVPVPEAPSPTSGRAGPCSLRAL